MTKIPRITIVVPPGGPDVLIEGMQKVLRGLSYRESKGSLPTIRLSTKMIAAAVPFDSKYSYHEVLEMVGIVLRAGGYRTEYWPD